MKIELTTKDNINMFTNWIDLLKTINNEMILIFTNEAVKANSLDIAKIIHINTIYKKMNFDRYEPPENSLELCLNLDELYDRLKSVDEDEYLSLEYDEFNYKFIIKFSKTTSERIRIFRMTPLEYFIPLTSFPQIVSDVELSLMMSDFDRAISDCHMVSDVVVLQAIKTDIDTLHIIAEGVTGDAEMKISGFEGRLTQNAASKYTISYLKDVIPPLKQLTNLLTLSFSNNNPMQLTVDSLVDRYELTISLAAIID